MHETTGSGGTWGGRHHRRSPFDIARRSLLALTASTLVLGVTTMAAVARPGGPAQPRKPAGSGCALGGTGAGAVKHVIYLQFDNTHLTRDNPKVPSDLQQLPSLLSFITGNGTMITHEHTPLIAHTANDIVTSETGLYPSQHGMPIANEYNYYTPAGATDTAGSFAYWTDPIVDYSTSTGAPLGDATPTMVSPSGGNTPAPWVSYTRAGCDFGSVAAANTELENTTPDVPVVFGADSPQAREAEDPSQQARAAADFMGLAIHCAAASATCSAAGGGRPDVLPDEPGGYHGYQALYGNAFVQPAISPSGPVRDLNGQVITDGNGNTGFPGYNAMIGTNALAYTLDMQTHGVPVTYTYLTDMHESWQTGSAFGPGEAGYVQQLREENAAFGTFFSDLAAHGITRANTLFVITADEGDHFVGGPPVPAGCDGVTVACRYPKIGEVDGNLTGLLGAKGIATPFDVAADSAPVVYVHGQPSRTAVQVRELDRAAATLTAPDLATGRTVRLTNYLADPVELKLLHMITGDPLRTPTLTLFANQDFWLSGGAASCGASCVSGEDPGEAWNHGDVGQQINTTWLGLAGPGVARRGFDNATWSDHTDIQPTMMALLGLRDDYTPDGRVLVEALDSDRLPPALRGDRETLLRLGRVYTQLEAAVGEFGLGTLRASTRALASDSPGDATYKRIESELRRLGAERDALAAQIRDILDAARPIDQRRASSLITQATRLLKQGID